ncbi:MAG: branched-chain amino acid ABC transporter permease, partial [Bacillota bacterium]|nr:branched-chain amino acid ABC transporter permease [Bacillota bacterium]
WGIRSYALPALWEGGPLHLGSIVFQRQYLFVLGAAAFFAVIFWLFFTRTLWGKALRASAVNPVGARLVGIPVLGMGGLAFTISALLAAMGGILAAPLTLATYDMGFMLGLKGFVGAIIGGGLVSLPGAVVGSLALGLLESLAAGLLPSGYRDAVAFSLLILVLIWRALPHIRRGVLLREEAASE